jgi:5'(3')-deoxyribonucleotidase
MRKVLGVDVDLTVVDPVTKWIKWYEDETNSKFVPKKNHYFIDELMVNHPSPSDFWKIDTLYDDLFPFEHSVDVLKKLSESYDIVFVSACFPEHINSKQRFLNRYFPFASGFISTKEKQYIKMDIFIDDHTENLELVKKYQPDTKIIRFKNMFCSGNDNRFLTVDSWEDINEEFLLKDYNN